MTDIQTKLAQSATVETQKPRTVNVGHAERNASILGGAALAMMGLLRLKNRHFFNGIAMMAAGSMFLYRGKTGHCDVYESLGIKTTGTSETGLTIRKSLTVNCQPEQVYEFWRDLSNLPRFMQHLESVHATGGKTSHWKAKGPTGAAVEWDAEIVEDSPNNLSWRSIGDAIIPNQGSVMFNKAAGGRGTELTVDLEYFPPAGTAGKIAAKIANAITAQQIEEDLKRFKQIMETGETATADMSVARAAAM